MGALGCPAVARPGSPCPRKLINARLIASLAMESSIRFWHKKRNARTRGAAPARAFPELRQSMCYLLRNVKPSQKIALKSLTVNPAPLNVQTSWQEQTG